MYKYLKRLSNILKNYLYPLKSIFSPTYIKNINYSGSYHNNDSALLTRKIVDESIKNSVHERDGSLNVNPYISKDLERTISFFYKKKSKINVLDIGGSFGNNYRTILLSKPSLAEKILSWTVVELEEIINHSKGLEDSLYFINWDQLFELNEKELNNYNIVYLSASFQYLSAGYFSKLISILNKIKKPHFLIIDRLLVNFTNKNLLYNELCIEGKNKRFYKCNSISLDYIINLVQHIGYEKPKIDNSLGSVTFTSDYKVLSYKSIFTKKLFK